MSYFADMSYFTEPELVEAECGFILYRTMKAHISSLVGYFQSVRFVP